jgi:adenosine deaminase
MRDAGLLLTINTDDPAMMAWDLGHEYAALAAGQGYDVAEMGRIGLEGIASTWLDDGERAALRASFEAELRALENGAQ